MQAVVLFARSPEREAAAKRMPAAVALFRGVIAAWLAAAKAAGATPLIACESRDRESLSRIAPHVERGWIEQGPGAFGERVCSAMEQAFARGFASAIIAAIDAPPPPQLNAALAALQQGLPVVAPARDGGVNFVGLTSPDRALLERLTPRRRDLVDLCRAHLPQVVIFDAATDVDSPSALASARRERIWRAFVPSAVLSSTPLVAPAMRGFSRARFSRPPPR